MLLGMPRAANVVGLTHYDYDAQPKSFKPRPLPRPGQPWKFEPVEGRDAAFSVGKFDCETFSQHTKFEFAPLSDARLVEGRLIYVSKTC